MSRYLATGAWGGLGRVVVDSLVSEGHRLVTIGRRPGDDIACDLAAMPGFAGLGGDIERQAANAPFDGIVHCAGVAVVEPLRLTTEAKYRQAMMAADTAMILLRAAARKGVMTDGASIVLMSSVAAHRGTAGMAAYSAGKAAIEAMARCAAVELAPRGIRVNCVAAGAFSSPMHDRVTGRMPAEAVDAYAAKHPLGFGAGEAVRDAVLHLLSPAARWTTGTVVVVDGGFLA